ncbi:MAG: DegT/DnrJ/EryC1/StrS family aminotransferase [Anaerolineaceae bacterium]|nr:DegT/DnrJ/EryC1/StrS family aminotransferase [Anaerolineaceae bacterium]
MDYQQKISVPMSLPDITDEERAAVAQVMATNYLSMGPFVQSFEQAFRDFTGAKHAIAVNSGTAGLHLCVRAAGWSDGDRVITTPFSFVSSTNVLLYERITPIFVDANPITGNIDTAQLKEAVEDLNSSETAAAKWLPPQGDHQGKLKGIVAVDVFGQPADYDAIKEIAAPFGLPVIEDSCEALGAMYKNRPAGMLGDMGVFAFYPNKQITTAEGGLVVTNDDKAAGLIRSMRNQGRAEGDTWLAHTYLGYNYRMDEMSAALGTVQMSRIDELIRKRAQVAEWYRDELSDIDEIELPHTMPTTTRDSWFVYVIRIKDAERRDEVSQKLKALGIPVRPYFSPIHLQPYMQEKFGYEPGRFPITEDLGRRGLAIPFSGKMTREQVAQVGSSLRQIF